MDVNKLLFIAIAFHLVILLLGVFSFRGHWRAVAVEAKEVEPPYPMRLRKRAA